MKIKQIENRENEGLLDFHPTYPLPENGKPGKELQEKQTHQQGNKYPHTDNDPVLCSKQNKEQGIFDDRVAENNKIAGMNKQQDKEVDI